MKEMTITGLKVAPMLPPEPVTLRNELQALQEAVSIGADYTGLIEVVELENDVCILCNEGSKLIGLAPNRRLGEDILCGVFYVVGQNEDGDFCSLSAEAMTRYRKFFSIPEEIDPDEVCKTLSTWFWLT